MILFIVVSEGSFKPVDVFRHGTKGCVLETVDTVHSTCQIGDSLLNGLSFACPVPSSLVEGDPVRNVSNIVVELPIAPVSVVGL